MIYQKCVNKTKTKLQRTRTVTDFIKLKKNEFFWVWRVNVENMVYLPLWTRWIKERVHKLWRHFLKVFWIVRPIIYMSNFLKLKQRCYSDIIYMFIMIPWTVNLDGNIGSSLKLTKSWKTLNFLFREIN